MKILIRIYCISIVALFVTSCSGGPHLPPARRGEDYSSRTLVSGELAFPGASEYLVKPRPDDRFWIPSIDRTSEVSADRIFAIDLSGVVPQTSLGTYCDGHEPIDTYVVSDFLIYKEGNSYEQNGVARLGKYSAGNLIHQPGDYFVAWMYAAQPYNIDHICNDASMKGHLHLELRAGWNLVTATFKDVQFEDPRPRYPFSSIVSGPIPEDAGWYFASPH